MSAFGNKIEKQAIDLTFTIYSYFKRQIEDPTSTDYKQNLKLIPTVAEATGLPEKTIIKIVIEKTSKAGNENQLLGKRSSLDLDNLTKCEIKRKVIQFYSLYHKPPTIKALNTTFIVEDILISTRSYLERLLKGIGFKYVDCSSNRRILMERASLVTTRWDYLQNIKKARDTGKPIIYVGETYISALQKANEEDADAVSFQNSNDGGFIVIHACDSKGFLNETMLIIQSKFNIKHYLNDMNTENFTWWVKEKLLPNLPPQALVVMNNTHFNSNAFKFTNKSTKSEAESWLKKHKVPFNENLKKSDLIEIIDNHQLKGDNRLNEIIRKSGHEVLRIPAVNSDLNAIEWIYRNVKRQIWNEEQLKLSFDLKPHVLADLLANYPAKECQNAYDKLKTIELEYFQHHINLDQKIDEMLKKIKENQPPLENDDESDSIEEMDISEEEN